MSWTRGRTADKTRFTFTCYDYDGKIFATGEFDTAAEADRAGEAAERRVALAALYPDLESQPGDPEMTLDEILKELEL